MMPGLTKLFSHGSYYFLLSTFLWWLYCGIDWARERGIGADRPALEPRGSRWREKLWAWGTPLLLAALVFSTVEPRLRVLSDETNLLSVSQSLFYDKTVFNPTMGKYFYRNFNPFNFEMAARPNLFPFLTYLVHLVRGYDYRNAFVLNFGLLVGLLALVFRFARARTASNVSAASICVLVLSCAIIPISATSGGFDILQITFIGFVFWLAHDYLSRPTQACFVFLLASLALFSHARYESCVLATLIAGALIAWRSVNLKTLKVAAPHLLFASISTIPIFLQRIVTEIEKNESPVIFNLAQFGPHLFKFLRGIVVPDFKVPFNGWVVLISATGLLAIGTQRWCRRVRLFDPTPANRLAALAAGILLAQLLIILAKAGVSFPHPAVVRHYAPVGLMAALGLAIITEALPALFTPQILAVFSLAAFALHYPAAIENRTINSLTLYRETAFNMDFLVSQGKKNILAIHDRPGQFCALEFGAVDFRHATDNAKTLLKDLDRNMYEDIYVFQRIRYDSWKPVPESTLSDAFELETLRELQNDPNDFLRISRVVRRKRESAPAPAPSPAVVTPPEKATAGSPKAPGGH